MRRRRLPPPPPPTPEGYTLVLFQNERGERVLGAVPNELAEAYAARRMKAGAEYPEWRDDPSYFWRRGSRDEG